MPTEISGSTGVNKIQDNTIVNADINSSAAIAGSKLVMPTGSVLQVAAAVDTTRVTFTGTNDYLGLQTVLTPSSTSNKILVMASAGLSSSGTGRVEMKCYYGTTGGDNSGSQATGTAQVAQPNAVNTANLGHASFSWLISPNSTSPIYVKLVGHKHDSGTGYYNYWGSASIVAMEIAG